MSARTEKGLRWLKWVALMVIFSAVFKVLFWIGTPQLPKKVAEALAILVGGLVLWGGLAFIIGLG
jgi:hypothetical protein